MRIACVYAPQIALQAVLRRDRELREGALALADGKGERARIVAFTRAAHRAGVRLGMTVCQARAMAGGQEKLRVFPASPADTAAAQAALADVGYGFAPRVQSEDDRIFFEVGDLRRLFPSEQALAQAVTAQAARVGLAARVAIAASKGVARVSSRAQDIAIVPAGGEAAFLAPLPVGIITNDDLETRLSRWGIRSLGALARLPQDAVVLRLGEAGARLWRLAAGCDEEPLAPLPPPDAVEEGTEIDYPICELEPLAFVLRSLLDQAMTRLQGRGCAGLTLRFKLDPCGFEVRQVSLAAPTRETSTLLELTRLALTQRPPSAPVVGVALLVLPAQVRAVQLDLLRPSGPAPERLAATLARLSALVGIENLGAPAEVDSFREEAVGLGPYETRPDPVTNEPQPPAASRTALAFRRFRPPQELEIIMGRQGPTALRGKATTARILMAAGPYRASGEWWSGEGFSRDYWDVHASDGAVYRVHQDQQSGQWFLDGYYD
ncbi:MAG TPA: DNA polymerase Y family protein [Polyangia bacterium]|nr:DNA polymerase Y family protein [Polyangia bacterium]